MNSENYRVSLVPRYIFKETQISGSRLERPSSDGNPGVRTRSRRGVRRHFPVKLHALLDSNNHEDVISWQPSGRSFIIHNPKEFVDSVMPKYFRQTQLRSFQRQLNLYDFHRISEGFDIGGYYHKKFLRGAPDLCKEMKRVPVKCKPQICRNVSVETSSVASSMSLIPSTHPSIIANNCPIVTTPRINKMFRAPMSLPYVQHCATNISLYHELMQEPISAAKLDHSPNTTNDISFQGYANEAQRPLAEVRTVSDEWLDDLLCDDMSFSLELSAIDLHGIFDHEDESE
jgi:hypothetical protein